MITPPAVSIILPTYNRAHLLPRAIASVLGQSWHDFELIVVDDGSTDDTERVVRSFSDPRVVFLPPERNMGDAGARNRGAAQARGQWLAFQDSDDEWFLEKLQKQMNYARELPSDFAAVGCTLLRFVGGPVEQVAWPLVSDAAVARGEVDARRFLAGFTAYLQSLLVQRSAFEAVGGFDTKLKARSDFEFCLRLSERYRIAAIDEPLVLSYETPGCISSRPDYRQHDINYVLNHHHRLIHQSRTVAGHYWYELAKAEVLCGHSSAGMRAALNAIKFRPQHIFSWIVLLISPFKAPVLHRLTRFTQRVKRALP